MVSKKYSEAITAFEALNGYKDSIEKIEECNISMYGSEVWNIIKNTTVGSYYMLGTYEQDNNVNNGKEKIEWLVLAKEGSKILVISKYALDCIPYNTSKSNITWETSSVRKWLNGEFFTSAFSETEKTKVLTVSVSADSNTKYKTDTGNSTQDKVFLLSIAEVDKYFTSSLARRCQPTTYASKKGVYLNSSIGCCIWWLRSPGESSSKASGVFTYGDINLTGYYVNDHECSIRPAMWIDLNNFPKSSN